MRASPLIEYSSTVLILCLWIGAITSILSSLIGLFQQDIKKVIAYSTMSQLAQECVTHSITFRYQTICEKIILIPHILLQMKIVVIYCLFYLMNIVSLNGNSSTNLSIESSEAINSECSNNILNPFYVTGFCDGESCFLINVQPRSYLKLGYNVSLMFKLTLHSRDKVLLENIRNYFGQRGNITTRKDGSIEYIVSSIKDLEVIIKHFDAYPLITQKWSDYQIFKQTFELIKRKEHLTKEGLKKVLSLKASFNKGLSDELKTVFTDIVPALRPQISNPKIQDPYWISGFVDGEGCFYVSLTNNSTGIGLVFKVTQHIRDADLLKEFIGYFNCGRYSICSKIAGVSNSSQKAAVTLFTFIKQKRIIIRNYSVNSYKKSLPLHSSLPISAGLTLSNLNEKDSLNAYFVTGFSDAESCFYIGIYKNSNKTGWKVKASFQISLHQRDIGILELHFGGVGNVSKQGKDSVQYRVASIQDLINVIIPHFEKYPLISNKRADFELFKLAVDLINCKEHLTIEGVQKIVAIKASLNLGLSDELKVAFSNTIQVKRPLVWDQEIKDPNWLAGFVSGEGCFYVNIYKSSTKLGESVKLGFSLGLHSRDTTLLKSFISYLGCGNYNKEFNRDVVKFVVTKFSDINIKIIPFFNKYPIFGLKSLDFSDFEKVAKLIENKVHLTAEGFEQIRQIKLGMNRGRMNKEQSCTRISTSPLNCSQKRTYVTMSALPKYTCQGNRPYSIKLNKSDLALNDKNFNEWLAGLIDGDGLLFVSKKGYANLKIIMSEKDKSALYEIKHKFGGSIRSISGSKKLKYKLHHKKGLIKLINSVNGLIRNPSRMLQLNKLCVLYNIEFKAPKPLTYYNGWFSGFVDSDGSIFFNEQSDQLVLSVTQKNKYLLDPLIRLYCGRIKILSSKEAFQYSIYRKKEILDLIDNYFKKYPLRSAKTHKINLIKNFYSFKDYKNLETSPSDKNNEWIKFKNKWDKL